MPDTIRPARTDSYEHTISGLLTKRADLFHEAERLKDKLAEIKNDVQALDRVLGTLGYVGNPDAAMPRPKRPDVFGRGALTRSCVDILRTASGPLRSRQVAEAMLSASGRDTGDRKLVAEQTNLVSRALRQLRIKERVTSATDGRGTVTWALAGR